MHIIVLEPYPSSRRGGQELVLLDICRGLAKRGHKIALLYTKEENLLEQYREFCYCVIKVSQFINSQPQHILSFLADIWKVTRKIPKTENSIVLCNQATDTPFASALALSKNIPLVCYLHYPPVAPPSSAWMGNKGIKRWKYFLLGTIHKYQWSFAIKKVKHFITVSNQTKLDWVNSGYQEEMEEKIDVVYNGIDLETYKNTTNFSSLRNLWNLSEDVKTILYVGRIDKEKGLEILLKAFALLRETNANTQLLIAGKPLIQGEEYKQSLEKLVIELGIENHVKFLGYVKDTTSLYQISNITVLPSIWPEPFGRTIVESMASGTPVVASRIGGIAEILTGEFQIGLFDPGNEQDLSVTLNCLLNWKDRDPNLAQRCRQHIVSQFSMDTMVDAIEKVMKHRLIQTSSQQLAVSK
ncbi:MAG: glycosyltransferase family 4 protein [Rhizonema sp. NSF051]|nr:glycosyltransferase family 4 protein [Rhizonema sp. NSF051]